MTAIFTSGFRSPFARAHKGSYVGIRPDDLLVALLNHLLENNPARLGSEIDDLIVGCAYPEGEQGYNIGRMAALGAGLSTPGCTVNRLCASSLEAVAIAAGRINSGWGDTYLVAGVESMTRIPRRGASFSESSVISHSCKTAYVPNGETAENVASRYSHIDRERQEDFAARSHELADRACLTGKYRRQIFPYLIERDEFIRVPVDRNKMAGLKPVFRENGIVTAATSSPLTDGATCGVVMSENYCRASGVTDGLEIVDVATAHVGPEVMGIGPVPSTRTIFERQKISADDIAAVEINEAFAIQVIASIDELGIQLDKVNCWGGALAIGHPLGASGLRLVMTLHDRLAEIDQPGSLGLATLCVGGGQGMSILFRYVKF